jgi:hypothetical protein
MSDGYGIKQIQPVIGDWFCISNIDRDRWFIERIVAWALVEAEGEIDQVKPILPNGYAPASEDRDFYCFPSDEIGFLGISWGDVYRQANADHVISRDITELVRKHKSKP